MHILAQAQENIPTELPEGFAEGFGIFGIIMLIVGIVVQVLFLYTLYKAMKKCSEDSRAMAPGLVWLALIPFFSLIWNFFNVINIAKSLDNEFTAKGIAHEERPGMKIGLAYAILAVLTVLPILGMIVAIGALVFFIWYWMKVSQFSKELEMGPAVEPVEEQRPV